MAGSENIPHVVIPLLFLAPGGRSNLRQEEFFGDILVRICRAEEGEAGSQSCQRVTRVRVPVSVSLPVLLLLLKSSKT